MMEQIAANLMKDWADKHGLGKPDKIMIAEDSGMNGVACQWGEIRQAVALKPDVDPREVKRLIEAWA